MPKLPSRGGPPAKPTPYPYQAEGIKWLSSRSRGLLADEMGLGKSNQAIGASEGRTLIVAPKMLVLPGGNWDDELEKWSDDPSRFTQAAYSGLNARNGQKVAGRVNKNTNKVIAKEIRPEYEGHWDTVILDEAHYIKNRNATWTQALDVICKDAERVILLTGTPIPNWAPELFPALRLLHPGKAKKGQELGSYWRWAGKWFDTTPETIYVRGQARDVPHVGQLNGCTSLCARRLAHDPCEHYKAFFEANLSGVFLRRLRDDVLSELPPLTVVKVETPMVPAQKKLYNQVKKEAIAELDSGALIVAWAETSKHSMCEKISTGANILEATANPGGAARLTSHKDSGKLDRLKLDLESRSRPTVVFAHYRASVEAARRVAESVGCRTRHIHGGVSDRDRAEAIRLFKAGELDVLVGSLETMSAGLTLTQADMVIFLETSYKPSVNEQAMRRIHRPGQDRPCVVLDYVTPKTVDEGKRELLAHKSDHQMRTLSPAQLIKLL